VRRHPPFSSAKTAKWPSPSPPRDATHRTQRALAVRATAPSSARKERRRRSPCRRRSAARPVGTSRGGRHPT